MNTQVYNRGDLVIEYGHKSEDIFILLEGELRVEVNGKTVSYINRDEIFGELAYIGDMPRTADVIATDDSLVMKLPVHNIEEQLEKLDPWARELIKALVNKIDYLTRLVESVLPIDK